MTFEGKEYTDTKADTLPATGHSGEIEAPTSVNITDYATGAATCTLSYVCDTCGKRIEVAANVSLEEPGAEGAWYIVEYGEESYDVTMFSDGYTDGVLGYLYDETNDCFIVSYTVESESVQETLTVPDTFLGKPISTLGESALSGAQYSAVVLGENLTTIEDGAFSNAENVTALTVTAANLEAGVFEDCSFVTVTIGTGVDRVVGGAFVGVTGAPIAESVVFLGDSSWDAYDYSEGEVGEATGDSYTAADLEDGSVNAMTLARNPTVVWVRRAG